MNDEQRRAEIKMLIRVGEKAVRNMDSEGVLNNWTEFMVKNHLKWLMEQDEKYRKLAISDSDHNHYVLGLEEHVHHLREALSYIDYFSGDKDVQMIARKALEGLDWKEHLE